MCVSVYYTAWAFFPGKCNTWRGMRAHYIVCRKVHLKDFLSDGKWYSVTVSLGLYSMMVLKLELLKESFFSLLCVQHFIIFTTLLLLMEMF